MGKVSGYNLPMFMMGDLCSYGFYVTRKLADTVYDISLIRKLEEF